MRATSSCALGGSVFFIDSDVLTDDSYSRFRAGLHRLVNNPAAPGQAIITIDMDRHPTFAITPNNLVKLLSSSKLCKYRPMIFLVTNKSEQHFMSLTAENTIEEHNTVMVHAGTSFNTIVHNDSQALVDKKLNTLQTDRPDITRTHRALTTASDLDLALEDSAQKPQLRMTPRNAAVIPSLAPAPLKDWHATFKALNMGRAALCPSDVLASDLANRPGAKPKKIIVSIAAITNLDSKGSQHWGPICHTYRGEKAICPRAPVRFLTNALRLASGTDSSSINHEKDLMGYVDLTRPMVIPYSAQDSDTAKAEPIRHSVAHGVHAKVLNNTGEYCDVTYIDQPLASNPSLVRRTLLVSNKAVGMPYIYAKVQQDRVLQAAILSMNIFSNSLLADGLDFMQEFSHRFSLLVKTTEGMFLHQYKYKQSEGYPALIGKPVPVADNFLENCDVTLIADRFEREAAKTAIGNICHDDISHITTVDADQVVSKAIAPFTIAKQELESASAMGTPVSLKSSTTTSSHSGFTHEPLADHHEKLSTLGHSGVPAAEAEAETKESDSRSDSDEDYLEPVEDDPDLTHEVSGHLTPAYLRDMPDAPLDAPAATPSRAPAPPRRRTKHGIARVVEESKSASSTPPLFTKTGLPPRHTATRRFTLFDTNRQHRRVAPMPTRQKPTTPRPKGYR
ncbi:MAG: hypothetical protein P1U40_03050 [Coxiellaceae bacterium]|nr:hypothetical protein [Coxiellaceae bacterium]